MEKVWVLHWGYGDASCSQIVRVYADEKRANEDFALVEEDTTRNWHLEEVPFMNAMNTYYDPNVTRG